MLIRTEAELLLSVSCVTFSCSVTRRRSDSTSATPATRPALCPSCSTLTHSMDFSTAPASVRRQIFDFSCCLRCRSLKRSESRADDFTWTQVRCRKVEMQIGEMAQPLHVGHDQAGTRRGRLTCTHLRTRTVTQVLQQEPNQDQKHFKSSFQCSMKTCIQLIGSSTKEIITTQFEQQPLFEQQEY